MDSHCFTIEPGLQLENGATLVRPEVAYHTYGDSSRPVVWVCHALTANSDVFDWWTGLFGANDLFNPRDYFIVCANVLSSCYGTCGPLSVQPETDETYFHDYPQVTIRDMVAAHEALRLHLGINKIHVVIGGSLGGQQALEWNITHPEIFENQVLIATNARHSAWGIAFNESQRMAIEADDTWRKRTEQAGDAGMRAARAIALLSYRTYQTYERFQTNEDAPLGDFRASSYQQYQGEKLSRRFNAFSYYRLSKAMDSHHVGRGRGSVENALSRVRAKTLVLGIESDVLFPVQEQQYLASQIPGAHYEAIQSAYGHDGFLIETVLLTSILSKFLKTTPVDNKTGKTTPQLV